MIASCLPRYLHFGEVLSDGLIDLDQFKELGVEFRFEKCKAFSKIESTSSS